ncbi:MAG: hypothetical protein AB2A00_01670 [Myxococcota bacterium]
MSITVGNKQQIGRTGQVGQVGQTQTTQVGKAPETVLHAVAQQAKDAPLTKAPGQTLPALTQGALGALGLSHPTIQHDPAHQPVVGLRGDTSVTGPDYKVEIPLLKNTTVEGRKVEAGCIRFFEQNRAELVGLYRDQCQKAGNNFETDAAKSVFFARDEKGAYKVPEVGEALQGIAKKHGLDLGKDRALVENMFKATYNAEMHQVAHAMAKGAFEEHLKALPKGSQVLVTSGGCASGKSYAIEKGLSSEFTKSFGAIYDAAGEQCATENEWVKKTCEKYGHNPVYVYVQGNMEVSFKRSVERAVEKGRAVDVLPFANSYVDGAKNFAAFLDRNPGVQYLLIDNSGGAPREMKREELKQYGASQAAVKGLMGQLQSFSLADVSEKSRQAFVQKHGEKLDVMLEAIKTGASKLVTAGS